jgi:hypothetical protein
MGMSTIQIRLAPPMNPVSKPASRQTFRRPSGTLQRAALWRWLGYHLSGSHVSRCVVSATASSSPSCVRTLPIGDGVQTPAALLGRSPWEWRSGWRCGALPCMGSRCDWRVLPFSEGLLDGRGRNFNSPAKLLS